MQAQNTKNMEQNIKRKNIDAIAKCTDLYNCRTETRRKVVYMDDTGQIC